VSKPAPYQEIANDLRAQILDPEGALKPGDKLPSENELAKQFKCARNTAARALEQLRSEGLIYSTQGKPSRVRDRPQIFYTATGENFRRRQGTGKPNDIAEAEAQGYASKNRIIFVGQVPAPAEVAERLGVEAESMVVLRDVLNLIKFRHVPPEAPFEPMKVSRGYYKQGFAEGTLLAEARLIVGGSTTLIEADDGPFRRTIARFVEDIELRMPRPDEAEQLLIPPGVPVARILRTLYDTSGEALEVLDSLLPGDRYKLRYEIPVPEKT
jgi:GntR family transcriptional regulator